MSNLVLFDHYIYFGQCFYMQHLCVMDNFRLPCKLPQHVNLRYLCVCSSVQTDSLREFSNSLGLGG